MKLALSVLLLMISTSALAQPTPCSSKPYADFDFWLGSWQVHSQDGQLQGSNTISKEEGNCLVIERWRSAAGGTGQSYNYYNPASKAWNQLWVSQGAIIDYSGHSPEPGVMQLTGEIYYQADGRTAPFKGTWTLRADKSVLQEFREQNVETGEWSEWFTGVYTRTP